MVLFFCYECLSCFVSMYTVCPGVCGQTRASDALELSHECWELNSGLQEQQEFLTAEPSPQSPPPLFVNFSKKLHILLLS